MPLAWRNVTHDRKRLARSAAGIGFAVLLMLIQLGFRNAFLESSLALLDSIHGDLMIVSATKYRLGMSDTFPRRRLHQALGGRRRRAGGALDAEWTDSIWKNPQTGRATPSRSWRSIRAGRSCDLPASSSISMPSSAPTPC